MAIPIRGLSPRVRGNPPSPKRKRSATGSIPACAGEPQHPEAHPSSSAVYPRVCGGTLPHQRGRGAPPGLSPRVRGNHRHVVLLGDKKRSIPACAGEPARSRCGPCGSRVYPRVCGGTGDLDIEGGPVEGLSPRVRGNHPHANYGHALYRSIPACAGEPVASAVQYGMDAVYPRVCGGTRRLPEQVPDQEGLSPRVRGNRSKMNPPIRNRRSIPACAGEPPYPKGSLCHHWVYPRVWRPLHNLPIR